MSRKHGKEDGESPRCHADRDGDCTWRLCPQLKDHEPARTDRDCPLDRADEETPA